MSSEQILLDAKQNNYKDYDPQFTADISQKMQLPERLVAVNGYYDDSSMPFASLKGSHRFDLPLSYTQFEEPHYLLTTPPSSITNYAGTTLADEDFSDSEVEKLRSALVRSSQKPTKGKKMPVVEKDGANKEEEEEFEYESVPMTPGTMLLMQNGDSLAALQRQIGKLSHRVMKLQEDNKRRKNRELVFYPLVIGYLILQLGRLIFKSH